MNIHTTFPARAILLLSLCLGAGTAAAVPFSNGDFSAGLSDWTALPGNGSVGVVGGQAQLDTGPGDDPFSAILVQGDDGNFAFANPVMLDPTDAVLSFDVEFLDCIKYVL